MNTRAKRNAAIGERKRDDRSDDQRQPKPRGRAKELARRDQRLRQPWQCLPALLVDRHHLRHDIGQQNDNDGERDQRDQHRIDERRREFLTKHGARFEIIGESRENIGKSSGFAARRDESAIQRAEGARESRHCDGQRLAGRNMCA